MTTEINQNVNDNQNDNIFTVRLNDQKALEDQLVQFKKTSDSYEKHQRKRRKKRYYNLALAAKIESDTTYEEVKLLMKNNLRTFLMDVVTSQLHDLEYFIEFIKQAQTEQQAEEPNLKLIIGIILQISGDACQFGRIRNNCSVFLSRNDNITLTTNTAYRYSCFKEIAFAINLKYYLPLISLNDQVSIGKEVRGCVIKKLKTALTIRIDHVGIVNSYDLIELPNQCYKLPPASLEDIFIRDLQIAGKLQVDFIALQNIRSLPFLKLLHKNIKTNYKFKLIGSIDLEYIRYNMLDTSCILKYLDYIWLTNLFGSNQLLNTILSHDVIPAAKCLNVPIIGSVPLEHCNDFKLFENHEFLWKIDCMFIEKSKFCNKFPLIVQKLLPIKNYRLAMVENLTAMQNVLTNTQCIVNFVIRTISSIECQAIFIDAKCDAAVKAFSRVEIYCPVYVMVLLEETSVANMEQYYAQVEIIKNLHLRRNLRPVPYTLDMNECEFKPIDYGIEYVRKCGGLQTGDFVITLQVGKENGDDHADLGVGEDMVVMSAMYVPTHSVGEKFDCI